MIRAFAAICAAFGPCAPSHEALALRPVVGGLDSPVYVAAPRSEPGRLYVVEQPGRIRVFANGSLRTFLDIRTLVRSGGELGLLSMAFSPRYATDHRFYVDYTARDGDTQVVEYRSNGTTALIGTARQLLFVKQPFSNHKGGQLQFGPDGLLYVGLGDGGSEGDPANRGQDLSTRLSKLLRINPFRAGSRWQMVGYGLRNPWRFSFDRLTGDLWIGDVGQDTWEEVDHRARSQLGALANYGWSVYEGRAKYKNEPLNRRGKLVWPVVVYGHVAGNCSITGGFVVRGTAAPSLRGRYVYGDYCSGRIWSLRPGSAPRVEPVRVASLSSFGEDARGDVYAVSLDGTISRFSG